MLRSLIPILKFAIACVATSSVASQVVAIQHQHRGSQKESAKITKGVISGLNELMVEQRASNNFIPACVGHLKKVSSVIDHNYADQQMQMVLENECALANDQPLIYEDGLNSFQACEHFARELTKARMQFLEQQSEEGYQNVCRFYWMHMYSKPVPKEDPPVLDSSISFYRALIIFGSGLLIVLIMNSILVKV